MKTYFYFLFFLMASSSIYSQTECEEANSDLIYAYSHVKSAYDSNNITHLKYYSNRSLEAFERSKEKLTKCGCETAYNLAYDGVELLEKVENAKTFEDGRFYVKRARDIGKASVIALDKCTISNNENEDTELIALHKEQRQLKQQQDILKAKEEQIKIKLAKQEEKELALKKERLITTYKSAISSKIKIYNQILEICNCNHETIKEINDSEGMEVKNVEDIKAHYLNHLKSLTSIYLAHLNTCSL